MNYWEMSANRILTYSGRLRGGAEVDFFHVKCDILYPLCDRTLLMIILKRSREAMGVPTSPG